MKWQPIETAPMDGTKIMLYGNGLVESGSFWKSESVKNPRARWVWNGWPNFEPTHWMPLPEPPQDFLGDIGHE